MLDCGFLPLTRSTIYSREHGESDGRLGLNGGRNKLISVDGAEEEDFRRTYKRIQDKRVGESGEWR